MKNYFSSATKNINIKDCVNTLSVKEKNLEEWTNLIKRAKESIKNSSLEKIEAAEVKTINIGTANKISRIVAWTFLSKEEQKQWKKN